MELNEKESKRLKQLEIEMLKAFIDVCEKLNLKYYVLGGTLLGTIRHQGFIPWDDDIDVGMPREDYEIFLEKAQELLPKHLFVQTCYTDPEYPLNFAKIRNSDTTFIETGLKKCKINHGVYIDMFPLDWHEDNKFKLKTFNFKKKLYSYIILKSFYFANKKDLLQYYASKIFTFFIPSKVAVRKRDKLLKSNEGKTYLANYCGVWGEKEIIPCEWYGEGVVAEFEGLKVKVPVGYDKWLTQVYGNYMQLPPEEKRVTHHFSEVIDLEKSYKEYIK